METGTLVHVDPSDLLLDTNVRTSVKIDADFKASIKSEGVLQPVVAVLTDDGLHVRYGQRRTIAAAEVGEPAIPVYVVSNDGEADRIVKQVIENSQRASITPAEELNAVQQLAMIGVKPTEIARRTRIKRKDVDAAIAIIGDDTAMRIAQDHTLTVAGWCQEFAEDEATVGEILRLASAGGEDRARHYVERSRQARDDKTAYATAAALVTDQVVIARPSYSDQATPLNELVDGDRKDIDPDAHRACPGHAIVLDEIEVWTDDEAAEESGPVDLEAAGRNWTLLAYCTNPTTNGHQSRYSRGGAAQAKDTDPKAKEKQAAERKRVIAGNKAWDAACIVRKEWVAKLLQRKAAPADAVLFALRAIAGRIDLGEGRQALRERVGAEGGYGAITVPDLTAPAAIMALLAYVLTALEAGTDRGDWRREATPTGSTALYLKQLQTWGYTLSDAEIAATGGTKFTTPKAA